MRHFEDRLNDIVAAVNDRAELVKRGHTAFVADPLLIRGRKTSSLKSKKPPKTLTTHSSRRCPACHGRT